MISTYEEWLTKAQELGWVHVHDHLVVVDDENDVCVGEWNTITETGFIKS